MKPTVSCQPLSKFGMLTFVISYTVPFIGFFYPKIVEQTLFFEFCVRERKRGNFQRREKGTTLG